MSGFKPSGYPDKFPLGHVSGGDMEWSFDAATRQIMLYRAAWWLGKKYDPTRRKVMARIYPMLGGCYLGRAYDPSTGRRWRLDELTLVDLRQASSMRGERRRRLAQCAGSNPASGSKSIDPVPGGPADAR